MSWDRLSLAFKLVNDGVTDNVDDPNQVYQNWFLDFAKTLNEDERNQVTEKR